MAWEHLSITKPHLVYIILGGFTSLFMLCSTVIKERLYIGEATVATLCGIIFGPHAANLINPLDWGNTDLITLEFSRIVLVVQCFAVGVELPKFYMERHWKSVTLLLVPVMTWGWLLTSLFIWWMFGNKLNWLDSLCVAACVTATDPVLASSVVGKGKFAKRVPKHLRDLLSAESGCNDGMAFPFVYLAIYIIRYKHHPNEVALHWFCYTILYECIFGAFYGVTIGYLARRAIKYAHEKDLIDRESFLVFYFVLALFCAGSGSLLGMDDLLVGFACGVGFSNDGWFQEKTEESHVSNVIDLLINLAFFVYFGTIIPWDQYNSDVLGISPWRLVVVGILVLFFRRIPIMLLLKPIIPDIKTWREASFAGHFGPIGVGAIFVAILARAELETEETTPLAVIPEPGFPHLNIIELIWPITTFLVIVSIVVHGSSIAVFTLGRHINTLAISVSFTKAADEGPSWMERLPRIQSRSKSSMSLGRPGSTDSTEFDEKMEEGVLSPSDMPKGFLRRLKDDDAPSRASSVKASKRRKKWDGHGPGGPVSSSAIKPAPRFDPNERSESDTLAAESPDREKRDEEPEEEVYREGDKDVIEDEEGNVLEVVESQKGESQDERNRRVAREGQKMMKEHDVEHGVAQDEHQLDKELSGEQIAEEIKQKLGTGEHPARPGATWRDRGKRLQSMSGLAGLSGLRKKEETAKPGKKHGPALAYQFGNTIIVEDEDGEVIKKYDIPKQTAESSRPGMADRRQSTFADTGRQQLQRMGTWMGMGGREQAVPAASEAGPSSDGARDKKPATDEDDDAGIRFTVGGAGGRRMSKADFIQAVSRLDPKSRQRMIDSSDAPENVKREVASAATSRSASPTRAPRKQSRPEVQRVPTAQDRPSGPDGLTLVDSDNRDIPFHAVSDSLAQYSMGQGGGETAAQRRRRRAQGDHPEEDQDPRGRGQARPRAAAPSTSPGSRPAAKAGQSYLDEGETAAERKRRLAALGGGDSSSSSDEDDEQGPTGGKGFRDPSAQKNPRIRFAEPTTPSAPSATDQSSAAAPAESSSAGQSSSRHHGMRLRWGANVGKKPEENK